MFPETAFLHDPAMLWRFVAAPCLQVVVIASLYLAVARIPARWVPWLRIATLAAFAAICIGSNALVIAHGFGTPGFVYSLGLAAAVSLIATVALVHGQWRQWLARRKGAHAVPQTAPIGWPIVKHVPEVDLRVGRPHLDAVAPRDAMIRVLGQQLVRDRLGERRPTAAGIEFVAR